MKKSEKILLAVLATILLGLGGYWYYAVYNTPFTNASYERPNYEELAKNGDAEAQYQLGLKYYADGDMQKSFELYQMAANQGHIRAQNNLGACYAKGDCAEENIQTAIQWYEKAAERGHTTAQTNLSNIYRSSEEVPRDYTKAFSLSEKAASAGDADGEAQLGLMYFQGIGVEQDYKKAFEWNKRAADKGQLSAQYNLASAYRDGLGTNKDLIKAGEYYQKSIDKSSQKLVKYLKGKKDFCNQNDVHNQESANACLIAAGAGDEQAQFSVGAFFHSGTFVNIDLKKAEEWFLKAARQGNHSSMFMLAEIYTRSNNIEEAFAWVDVALRIKPKEKFQKSMGDDLKLLHPVLLDKMNAAQKQTAQNKANQYFQVYNSLIKKSENGTAL